MYFNLKSLLVPALILLVLVFFVPLISLAQDRNIEKGTALEAKQEVKLRASPPKQNFLVFSTEPGKAIGSIKPGEKVKVEELQRVKVPLDEHLWVRVKTDTGSVGWAYFGSKDTSPNFIIKE
jgi:hypothetical protein